MPLPNNLGELILRGAEGAAKYTVGSGAAIGDAYMKVAGMVLSRSERETAQTAKYSEQQGAAMQEAAARKLQAREAQLNREAEDARAQKAQEARMRELQFAQGVREGKYPVESGERLAQLKGAATEAQARRDAAARSVAATGIFETATIDGQRAGIKMSELAQTHSKIREANLRGDFDAADSLEQGLVAELSRQEVRDVISTAAESRNPSERSIAALLAAPRDFSREREIGRPKSADTMISLGLDPTIARKRVSPDTWDAADQTLLPMVGEALRGRTEMVDGKPVSVAGDPREINQIYSVARQMISGGAGRGQVTQQGNTFTLTRPKSGLALAPDAAWDAARLSVAMVRGTGISAADGSRILKERIERFSAIDPTTDPSQVARAVSSAVGGIYQEGRGDINPRHVLDFVKTAGGNLNQWADSAPEAFAAYSRRRTAKDQAVQMGVLTGEEGNALMDFRAKNAFDPAASLPAGLGALEFRVDAFTSEYSRIRRVAAGLPEAGKEVPTLVEQLAAKTRLDFLAKRATDPAGVAGVKDAEASSFHTVLKIMVPGVTLAEAKTLMGGPGIGTPSVVPATPSASLADMEASHNSLVASAAEKDKLGDLAGASRDRATATRLKDLAVKVTSQQKAEVGPEIKANLDAYSMSTVNDPPSESLKKFRAERADVGYDVAARWMDRNPMRSTTDRQDIPAAVRTLREINVTSLDSNGRRLLFRMSDAMSEDEAAQFLRDTKSLSPAAQARELQRRFVDIYDPLFTKESTRMEGVGSVTGAAYRDVSSRVRRGLGDSGAADVAGRAVGGVTAAVMAVGGAALSVALPLAMLPGVDAPGVHVVTPVIKDRLSPEAVERQKILLSASATKGAEAEAVAYSTEQRRQAEAYSVVAGKYKAAHPTLFSRVAGASDDEKLRELSKRRWDLALQGDVAGADKLQSLLDKEQATRRAAAEAKSKISLEAAAAEYKRTQAADLKAGGTGGVLVSDSADGTTPPQ